MPWYDMTFREFHSKYAYINNDLLFQAAEYCGLPPSAVVYLYVAGIALISFVPFVYYFFYRMFMLPVGSVVFDHPNNRYRVLMSRTSDIAELAGIEIRSTVLFELWIICLLKILRWHGSIRQFLISATIYWQKQLAQFMPWGVQVKDERVTLPLRPSWKIQADLDAESEGGEEEPVPEDQSTEEEPVPEDESSAEEEPAPYHRW